MGNTDDAWVKYGDKDPYYGVLSDPRYQAHLDPATRTEFFESGEKHISAVFAVVRSRLEAGFSPATALDFGCGVGRLVIPLAREVSMVVGVDVSASMLREAAKNCEIANVNNVVFIETAQLALQKAGSFDFVHSFIVFQHIPVERGILLFKQLITLLSDEGVGAFHFTFDRRATKFRIFMQQVRASGFIANGICNVLAGKRFSLPYMEMNRYPLSSLMRILYDGGFHDVHYQFSDHNGYIGAMLYFKKGSLPTL